MDLLSAIKRISDGLGFRTGLDQTIRLRLVEAQTYLQKGVSLPRFLRVYDDPLSWPLGAVVLPWPTGFLKIMEENLPYFNDDLGDPVFLQPRRNLGEARSDFLPSQGLGPPKVYLQGQGERWIILPSPDKAYTIFFSYYRGAKAIPTDGTNIVDHEWLNDDAGGAEWLMGEAGYRLAMDLGSPRISVFDNMRQRGQTACLSTIIEQDVEDEPIFLGSDL